MQPIILLVNLALAVAFKVRETIYSRGVLSGQSKVVESPGFPYCDYTGSFVYNITRQNEAGKHVHLSLYMMFVDLDIPPFSTLIIYDGSHETSIQAEYQRYRKRWSRPVVHIKTGVLIIAFIPVLSKFSSYSGFKLIVDAREDSDLKYTTTDCPEFGDFSKGGEIQIHPPVYPVQRYDCLWYLNASDKNRYFYIFTANMSTDSSLSVYTGRNTHLKPIRRKYVDGRLSSLEIYSSNQIKLVQLNAEVTADRKLLLTYGTYTAFTSAFSSKYCTFSDKKSEEGITCGLREIFPHDFNFDWCIPREKYCDGVINCPNAQDERICLESKLNKEYKKIATSLYCNGVNSQPCDEDNCYYILEKCNGHQSCSDGKDEECYTGTTDKSDSTLWAGILAFIFLTMLLVGGAACICRRNRRAFGSTHEVEMEQINDTTNNGRSSPLLATNTALPPDRSTTGAANSGGDTSVPSGAPPSYYEVVNNPASPYCNTNQVDKDLPPYESVISQIPPPP